MKAKEDIRLCVCIPTYNREECIERVLQEEIAFFREHEIDCYIYDSSTTQGTERVVERYIQEGYGNLVYRHIDSDIHSAKKAYSIWREMGESDYDFVWLIHDHTVCLNGAALDYLKQELAKEYDFYIMNLQCSKNGLVEAANLDDFLLMGAWPLNSFGASIVNTKTFLRGVDWQQMEDKYLVPRTINHSHIGFYFERAAQIPGFRACRLELERESFIDFLRNEKTSWDSETIRICTECWGSVISMLPEVYHKKKEALLTQDKWFLATYKMIFYKQSKQYNFKTFWKYRKWLALIRPEDYRKNLLIACVPFAVSKRLYCSKVIRQAQNARAQKASVAIFGAGRHAVECANLLDNLGLEYDGFLVTNRAGNPETLLGHQVYEAAAYLKGRHSFVFIAILTSGAVEVSRYLDTLRAEGCQIDYEIFE